MLSSSCRQHNQSQGLSHACRQADFKRALSMEGGSQYTSRSMQNQRVDAMLATAAAGDAALVVGGDLTVIVAEVRFVPIRPMLSVQNPAR